MNRDDIHSCSYYCTRPACVLAQRNELRDKQYQCTITTATLACKKSVKQAEREAIIQTVNELTDDRHPMFEEGYRYALRHIREFIEGRGEE
jgi:hypothetical protein